MLQLFGCAKLATNMMSTCVSVMVFGCKKKAKMPSQDALIAYASEGIRVRSTSTSTTMSWNCIAHHVTPCACIMVSASGRHAGKPRLDPHQTEGHSQKCQLDFIEDVEEPHALVGSSFST